MNRKLFATAAAAAGLALSGIAAETTDFASSPDFWRPSIGQAKQAPTIAKTDGPEGKPALRFTAVAEGKYQGMILTPLKPLTLEEGDFIQLQLRQTADPAPQTFSVILMFVKGDNLLFTTPPVGKDWTTVKLPLDLKKWQKAGDRTPATAFGTIRQISIYPGTKMDNPGETIDVADVSFYNANGSKIAVTLPDSVEPTEQEKAFFAAENWSGEVGNKQTLTAPKITIVDTPQGKAAVATVTSEGKYQGISVKFPEPVNLKKYKALTFELNKNIDKGGGFIYLYYTNGSGVQTPFGIRDGEWVPVRIDFDYENMQSGASFTDPAPGKVNKIKITLFEKLQKPGQELAIRKLHFIPKESDEEQEEE